MFDGDRVVGEIHRVEPEWDDEQRELVMAWIEWDADRGPHGQSMREALSEDSDPANPDGKILFRADPVPLRDHATQAESAAQRAYQAQYPDADMRGLIFPVRRVERKARPKRRHGGSTEPDATE